MPLIKVGTLSAFPPGSVTEVMIGDYPYAICNAGGTVRALSGVCIHRGGPLGQGQLHDGRVVCPYHLWEFDLCTGRYDYDPTQGVATYAVKVEGGDVFLQVP
jgi:nitrite reductase/ring-hydroxylating ferredoxin subunit